MCWLFGERCARERGLLPGLSESQRYRLLAWPDFGEIGGDVHGVELCRLLADEGAAPIDAARRLGLPTAVTFGLFNSAALCGALVTERDRRHGPERGPRGRAHTVGTSAQHLFFGDLWRRLKG